MKIILDNSTKVHNVLEILRQFSIFSVSFVSKANKPDKNLSNSSSLPPSSAIYSFTSPLFLLFSLYISPSRSISFLLFLTVPVYMCYINCVSIFLPLTSHSLSHINNHVSAFEQFSTLFLSTTMIAQQPRKTILFFR